ncbi:MAG: hypothetical protein VX265_18545 [Myxococcota bacterium]|nr:hypothetical protein [Myxococcota bacterium]
MRTKALLLALLLSSCDTKPGDSALPGAPSLTIVEPPDGAWLDEGAEVVLRAVGRDATGAEIELSDLAWSTGSWAVEGNDLTVTDIPPGNQTLEAQVLIDGAVVSDSVDISVFASGRR